MYNVFLRLMALNVNALNMEILLHIMNIYPKFLDSINIQFNHLLRVQLHSFYGEMNNIIPESLSALP